MLGPSLRIRSKGNREYWVGGSNHQNLGKDSKLPVWPESCSYVSGKGLVNFQTKYNKNKLKRNTLNKTRNHCSGLRTYEAKSRAFSAYDIFIYM